MRSKNSTNVRLLIPRLYQILLAGLARVSTGLAAALAERLFFSVPRRPESEGEAKMLASARRYPFELGGRRFVAWRWGEGPTALLVHGWGGSAAQMLPFVEPLRGAGYSVVAFDAPAHGHSEGRTSSLPEFAASLSAVAGKLGPVETLVTHSMGGAAASLAIAQGLAVGRAVYVAPPADALEWVYRFGRMLRLPRKVVEAMRRRAERRLHVRFDRLNTRVLGPAVRMPLLVIHDRSDAEVLWYDGAAVAHSVPNGRLTMTEGLGHRRILRDPGVVAEAVKFLVGEESRDESEERAASEAGAICAGCGDPLSENPGSSPEVCEMCALERELFDRELRWERDIRENVADARR